MGLALAWTMPWSLTSNVGSTDDGPAIAPGSLLRWEAPGTTSCGIEDGSWTPIGDSCFYPIDLLIARNTVTLIRHRAGNTERATVRVAPYPYPQQKLEVEPKLVNPPEDQLERIRRERERVATVWASELEARFALPLAAPLDPMPEGRSFGSRRVLNGEARSPHTGVDFSVAPGTPVHAADDGIVALASELYFAGNAVFIDHGDQLFSMYFHLSEIAVEDGAEVRRGQLIGKVGATGRVTGPHLHFAIRWHDARIDPSLLLADPALIPTIGDTSQP
jgi:murein DD-endopeptidase MepM/ murein hydrolase activator NlpD